MRPENPGTITVTAAVSADSGVSLGSPASVATDVVGAASGEPTPPAVLSAVRYGFHQQATILVMTYDKPMNPAAASNTKNYLVLDSSHGTARTVPISQVSYNAQSHQATLRVARHIYLFRPWRLVIRGEVTDMSGVSLLSDGVAGHGFATKMDSHSLNGPAWDAPQATRVGVKPAPTGHLAVWAEKVARAVKTRSERTIAVIRNPPTATSSRLRIEGQIIPWLPRPGLGFRGIGHNSSETIWQGKCSHCPIHGLGNPAALVHKLAECGGSDCLGAIADGVLGVVVNLDDQGVGPGGHGCLGHGQDQL